MRGKLVLTLKNSRFRFYAACLSILLVFSLLKAVSLNKEKSEILPANQISESDEKYSNNKENNGAVPQIPEKEQSLIKLYLLKKSNDSEAKGIENPERNIFLSIGSTSKKNEPQKKQIKEDPKPQRKLPPIKLKLVGIMAKQEGRNSEKNTKYAVLLYEEETILAQKGDVVNGKYKIQSIGEDKIEISDLEFDRIVVIRMEP